MTPTPKDPEGSASKSGCICLCHSQDISQGYKCLCGCLPPAAEKKKEHEINCSTYLASGLNAERTSPVFNNICDCSLSIAAEGKRSTLISKCCKSTMTASCADEGTCCYLCDACGKPSDWESDFDRKVAEEKCKSDNKAYFEPFIEQPQQYRCEKCGQFWFSKDEAPICKPVEMLSVMPVAEESGESWENIKATAYEYLRVDLKVPEWQALLISGKIGVRVEHEISLARKEWEKECQDKCLEQYAMGQQEGLEHAEWKLRKEWNAELVKKLKKMKVIRKNGENSLIYQQRNAAIEEIIAKLQEK